MADHLAPISVPQAVSASVVSAGDASIAPTGHGITFQELLSDLNPLQYIPIVGTIYRALTGDTIPDSVRAIGSLAVSGLMGGPIGLVTNLAFLGIEKAIGVDPEKIGQDLLASLGIKGHDAITPSPSNTPNESLDLQTAFKLQEPVAPIAWSPSQLLAYGVTTDGAGLLRRGNLQGSDVLNDMALENYTHATSRIDYVGFPDVMPAYAA